MRNEYGSLKQRVVFTQSLHDKPRGRPIETEGMVRSENRKKKLRKNNSRERGIGETRA